jgi:hypothetical protein
MEDDAEHLGNDLGIDGESNLQTIIQMMNQLQAVLSPKNPKNA